jgi:sugar O-acyltransferase (sialic acid O-acetyltransferase NeuD family)
VNRDLVIFGAAGLARLANVYFRTDSAYRVAGFCVDAGYRHGDVLEGLPLVDAADVERHFPPATHDMFVAIGYSRMNRVRAETCATARARGYTLASYVSSRAAVLTEHPLGDNCFICEHATIQPFARIGSGVIVWSGVSVAHDSAIGDYTFVAANATILGRCTVGRSCFIGANATLRNDITIADRTLVGAGAIVMADTREGGVYLPPRATLAAKTSDEIEI